MTQRNRSEKIILEGLGEILMELSGEDDRGIITFTNEIGRIIGNSSYQIDKRKATVGRVNLEPKYRGNEIERRVITLIGKEYFPSYYLLK